MALRNIKDRISSITEGENLGSAKAGSDYLVAEREKKEIKPKMKKESKPRKAREPRDKIVKPNREKHIEKSEPSELRKPSVIKDDSEKVLSEEIKTNDLIDGYQDIISMLGIKEDLNLKLDFASQDLDYVEFTQTQPLGFDFDEVTDFISRIKYSLYKLESALRQRDSDVKRLASEVKRVEEKMLMNNQEKELNRIMGEMTEEERLIQENMDLKVRLNETKRTLASSEMNTEANKNLLKRIEALEIENDILKSNKDKIKILPKSNNGKLPSVLEDEDFDDIDVFADMLEDIGGLYNE